MGRKRLATGAAFGFGVCALTTLWLDPLLPVAAAQPRPRATGAATGAPSPRNASYSIDARLDTEQHTLSGREVLTWRNLATIPATELHFHLYYNAWKNTRSTWMREQRLGGPASLDVRPARDWGWIDVTSLERRTPHRTGSVDLLPDARHIAPDDGNPHDETVLAVPLETPVAPGDAIEIEIAWTSRIPRTFARTGVVHDYFFLAQWFPKIGVFEDTGWNCHQFHAATEFFADYGNYDVRLTVPTGWHVGATGVIVDEEVGDDGTTTHHVHQEDVHDFAWTTSPHFVERRARFEHPSLPDVDIRLLLQPEHVSQAERHIAAARATLQHFGEWFGPYPYDHLTIVDPAWRSGTGGMEYPTLITAGTRWLAPTSVAQPEDVTIHETGHQFWYGVVGTNEFEDAWLDEGVNTYASARLLERTMTPNLTATRLFGGLVPWVHRDVPWSRTVRGNRVTDYRRDARQDPPSTPSFRYWPATAGSISYGKTAIWLHTLERYLGWPELRRRLATFFETWRFGHPTPDDFFRTVGGEGGDNLSWFFEQVHDRAIVFDYGVDTLTSRPIRGRGYFGSPPVFSPSDDVARFRTTVVARRYGEGRFPVEVMTAFEDGHVAREQWDGDARWTAFSYDRPVRATRAFVDPSRTLLLDTNTTNNSYSLQPRAGRAATSWSLVWLVWLQDRLLTYGFFL